MNVIAVFDLESIFMPLFKGFLNKYDDMLQMLLFVIFMTFSAIENKNYQIKLSNFKIKNIKSIDLFVFFVVIFLIVYQLDKLSMLVAALSIAIIIIVYKKWNTI